MFSASKAEAFVTARRASVEHGHQRARRGSKMSRLWDHSVSYTTSKLVKEGSALVTHSWSKETEPRMETRENCGGLTQGHLRHGKQQMAVPQLAAAQHLHKSVAMLWCRWALCKSRDALIKSAKAYLLMSQTVDELDIAFLVWIS